MKQIYNQVVTLHEKGGCNAVIESLLKGFSVNPVQNALWGWKGGNTESGNVYRSILPEIMHQLDHGVIPMLFELVGNYAKDKFGAKKGNKRLALANKRFLSFRNTHPGLRLPNIDFLGGSSFVTAFEHRHSLSVAVYAVVGVFTLPNGRDEITPLFRDFADVYLDFAVRHKTSGHTDESLAKVDADWDRVLAKMKRILPYQASGWGTVKVHTNAHSTESVSLKGLSGEYSADNYESSHKRTAKNPFRASNKNQMQMQMVKHVTDRLRLLKAGKDEFIPTRKETALRKRARAQRTNLLSVKSRPLRLFRLSSQSLRDGNRDPVLLEQPELVHLERVLRAHLGGNPRGNQALLANLPTVQDAKVRRHKTLAIARARQPDGSLKTELARANPCFGQNKRPVFSDVVVNGAGPERQGQLARTEWYAQLRLLFTCVDHRGMKRAFAFVKWYQRTGPQDGTKSVRLKWEMVKGLDGVEQVRYDVIGLQTIKRLEHILPDPNNEGLFYVNETRLV
ncbi:hypothetical protein KFL_010400020 [Klebsormidium nitens]|uniref:Uncharacterized protein n=1 Tax=Klebsormidium nitens TaxID=105231 RepID=A0A1Y1IV14_KLENI|nr:hypothetical protein KFL_010400020 [Klebsormidium nitens]|eukprot:GAQ92527.1 hypothetical protein KFL_010400020 [Klebsormidium nitens]